MFVINCVSYYLFREMEVSPNLTNDIVDTWISKAFYGYPFSKEELHRLCEEVSFHAYQLNYRYQMFYALNRMC